MTLKMVKSLISYLNNYKMLTFICDINLVFCPNNITFARKINKYVFIRMENKTYKRTTVTSALPYANGGVHIGHLAGVYVPADIYVRYLRLKKREVLFIGGSDEHGVPITVRARKEGITPQDVVDRSRSSVSRSISIAVQLLRHIISSPQTGSRSSTTRVN